MVNQRTDRKLRKKRLEQQLRRKRRGVTFAPPPIVKALLFADLPQSDVFGVPGQSSGEGWTSHYRRLQNHGYDFVDTSNLGDREIHGHLSQLVQAMADLNVYLALTDHLSDRELYDRLRDETLHDPIRDREYEPGTAFVLCLLNVQKEEHVDIYLRYYASDSERDEFAADFAGDCLPRRQSLPYGRDAWLPRP